MRRAWGRLVIIVSGVCALILLPIATNIATGSAVPEFFQQAWVSWTGVAVFGSVAVFAVVRTEWSNPSVLPPTDAGSDSAESNDRSSAGATGNESDNPEPEIPHEPIDALPVPLESLPTVRGRRDLLRQLIERRRTGGLVVLVGAGGMGKSTLAHELVRRTAGSDSPPAWEVSAGTSDRFFSDLRALAANLGGSVRDLAVIGAGERAGPDCLWSLLWRAPDRWLLIIDNADHIELLGKPSRQDDQPADSAADGTGWVRPSRTGLVLVTSRQGDPRRWPGSAVIIGVNVLDEKAAAQVLRDLAPGAGTRREARALARRLGGLPLVLHLAGLYLGSRYAEHMSFAAYREDLEADPRVIRLLEQDSDDSAAFERILVMRTWELSLDALERHGLPQARPLLRLLSCFSPTVPVPLALVQGKLDLFLTACTEPGKEPRRLNQVLEGLSHVGLITSTAERGLVIHPVIADTNRIHLMEGHSGNVPEEMVRSTAVRLVAAELDGLIIDRPSTWAKFRLLAPHLHALVANSASRLSGDALDTLTGTAGHVAIGYCHMQRTAFGIRLLEPVLAAHQTEARGRTVFMLARQRLAMLLNYSGQYPAAEQICQEVLTAQLQDWPADHPIVLVARYNVAVSQSYRQPRAQIDATFEALLADQAQALGLDHPVTLETRQAQALLLGSHHGWGIAEELLQGIIDDATRILGKDDSITLVARHNLAIVLRKLDRNEQAEADVRLLIEDEQRVLGDDHLITAATAKLDEGGFITTWPVSVPQLHAEWAKCFLRKGRAMANESEPEDREAALRVFDELITRFGEETAMEIRGAVAEGMLDKASLLNRLGRTPEAVSTYDDLIGRYDDDEPISLRYYVALAFHNKAIFSDDDPDRALEAAQQALVRYQRLANDKPEPFAKEAADAEAFVESIRATAPQSMLRHAETLAQDSRRRGEALDALQRFIARYGDDPSEQLRALVAKAMLRKGKLLASPPRPAD